MTNVLLWFDVGVKRYTTLSLMDFADSVLWFDVGVKRYTTSLLSTSTTNSCGLM